MHAFFKTFKTVLLFSLPIIAGQVGHMLFGVGDTILVGHYSTPALSALGIATAILSPFLIVGLGVTYVISPMKAQRLASKLPIDPFVSTSFVLTTLLGLVLSACLLLVTTQVGHMGYSAEVTSMVKVYLYITAISLVPALQFQAIKENLQAYEKTLFANGTILAFNGVNILLNYLLIFTFDLGIVGAAWATTISRFGMMITLGIHGRRYLHYKGACSRELLKSFLKKGIPVGLSSVVTATVFSMVTVLAGTFSVVASAANNIIITISATTFMVPYAIAGAVSVKVGQSLGSKKYGDVRLYTAAGVLLALLFAVFMATLFILFPHGVLSFASRDEVVLQYGIALLITVAIYQIPDAFQTVTLGALRGLGVTFAPFVVSFIGVWLVGFPVGAYLAYKQGMEVQGLWIGLALGLFTNATLLVLLLLRRSSPEYLAELHESSSNENQ